MLELVAALVLAAAPAGTPEEDVAAAIDALHAAAARADGAAYFDLFTPDARFIGTDASERWTLSEFRAFAEPFFARGQGWTYTPQERTVTLAPIQCMCIAWFDEVLENDRYGVTRGSGVQDPRRLEDRALRPQLRRSERTVGRRRGGDPRGGVDGPPKTERMANSRGPG